MSNQDFIVCVFAAMALVAYLPLLWEHFIVPLVFMVGYFLWTRVLRRERCVWTERDITNNGWWPG